MPRILPSLSSIFVAFLIVSSIQGLHMKWEQPSHSQTSSNQQQQLDYLIGLQTNYAQGISSLNNQAKTLRTRIEQTTNTDERIRLLQTAITDERSRIGQLSSYIIPDPVASRVECQIIPQQQQQKLNQQSSSIQAQIRQLQSLTKLVPDCNQITAIRQQIRKMKLNLQQIQQTSSNQCQQNLLKAPTVYITNLYNNNNWTYGSFTANQLIDQYYQNYFKYNNISNCPLDRPFIPSSIPASSIDSCIRCPDSRPIFDISIKNCIACPGDQLLDISTHKCAFLPKNSNYTYGPNYKLQPLTTIPTPLYNISCPSNTPFYNGTQCVSCPLPYYWQISQSKCYQCPTGQQFNINLHQCTIKLYKKLTVLNNTQWITGDNNITNVYNQRAHILQLNKTTKQYSLCPDQYPYYDNIACINCGSDQQFNLNTLKCTSPPSNTTYSPNLHKYVNRQSNKQMDPLTNNYISSSNLTDNPNIPNCNNTYPFYDKISCVYCSQPYIIFDYDNNLCTICDPYTSRYVNNIHKCIRRPSIYVYGNRQKLMATDTYSISDYDNKLQQGIRNNPQYVADTCPISSYAAVDKCIQCQNASNVYFNVQTYQCVHCDGMLDPSTFRCVQRKYYFVNTNANNLIIPSNTTLQQIKQSNDATIQANPTKYSTCPIQNPYPYNNKTICGKCPPSAPLYSIALQGCTYCPSGQAYDPRIHQCNNVIYLTNYDNNIIITQPNTLQSILQAQMQLNQTNITQKCPLNTPYTPDGKLCINCLPAAPYFDIQKGICVICTYPFSYSSSKRGCYQTYYLTNLSAPRLLQVDNYTVVNLRNQQIQMRSNTLIQYRDCPIQTPYGQTTMCNNCSSGQQIFNLKTQQCQRCPQNTQYWQNTRKCVNYIYITNLNSSNAKIVQSDIYTISNYRSQIQRQKLIAPTRLCPNQQPYAINGSCIQCPPQMPYYILSTRTCGGCYNYQADTLTCPPKPNRYPNLSNYHWVTNDANPDKYIAQGYRLKQIATGPVCPAFYNDATKQCITCPSGYYYNIDNKQCQMCTSGNKFDINTHTCVTPAATGSYFTNIQASPNNLQIYGGLTLNQIQTTQNSIKNQYANSQYCPSDRPFFDDIQCVKCPQYKKYFNLRHRLCQVCLYGEQLVGNDCINASGNKVWQEPIGENVYPFLFSKV